MIRARDIQEIQFILVVQGLEGEAAAEPPPSLPNPPYTRETVRSQEIREHARELLGRELHARESLGC